MSSYILRRLGQAALTIFGVMVITFLLFRVVAGDVSAGHVSQQASEEERDAFRRRFGYDKPLFVNRSPGAHLWDSQFFYYITKTVTFQTKSIKRGEKLTEIIRDRGPKSLAITVPAMGLGWMLAMAIATIVAYYRASLIDHIGVFVSVLGMCIPYLAFVLFGQWLMFQIKPTLAFGLDNPFAILVPITIAVVAGLGASVRFYRTIILDETTRDYVRTARAKGLPLPIVMFKHILRNCMLPILTNLVLAIPFLIMGNLLLERFFGIPGLGDLLISSVENRDEPIISGLTFLTALIYVLGNLLTDVCYAIFDPRVRLT